MALALTRIGVGIRDAAQVLLPTLRVGLAAAGLALLLVVLSTNAQVGAPHPPGVATTATLSAAGSETDSVESTARIAPWSERERRILESLSLESATPNPAAPSNRVAYDPAAVALGKKLFFDPMLSGNREVSCATCHHPEKSFTDGLPRSKGTGETLRNAPTLLGSRYQSWFYWDGRRDSLWAQALIPLEAAEEMGGSRVQTLRVIANKPAYLRAYNELFEEPLPDVSKLDPTLGPFAQREARAAWRRLPERQRQAINHAVANIGKAIAAYERTLLPEPGRFDRFVAALRERPASDILSAEEQLGLRLFIDAERTQCLQCHNGPMLSNGSFHNIGTGNFEGARMDFGRSMGLRAVLLDAFNCLGPYSDAEPEDCFELRFLNRDAHVPLEGAFKVPTLRHVAETAPYFHDGSKSDLNAVLQHYVSPPEKETRPHELLQLELTKAEIAALEAFLRTLSP